MSTIPGYLTVYEAAEIIGVSHAQVTRYVADDILEHTRVGRMILVKESAARKFKRPKRGNPSFQKK